MSKKSVFQNQIVLVAAAMFCCLLWGSAFPSIKLGYQLFEIAAGDSASQILFAGIRFTLAGILVILAGSVLQGKLLKPEKSCNSQNPHSLYVSDSFTIYFLLYWTGTYYWCERFYCKCGKCILYDPCFLPDVSTGKVGPTENHWLYHWLCRCCNHQFGWRI